MKIKWNEDAVRDAIRSVSECTIVLMVIGVLAFANLCQWWIYLAGPRLFNWWDLKIFRTPIWWISCRLYKGSDLCCWLLGCVEGSDRNGSYCIRTRGSHRPKYKGVLRRKKGCSCHC